MKNKFDLIAASKTRKYKLTMFSMLGVGLLTMIIGFVMMGGVTLTVVPNQLQVEMTGLISTGTGYQTTLSQDDFIFVNTGTGTDALKTPIKFNTSDVKDIIYDIEDMYRQGTAVIKLKPGVVTGDAGFLRITCGNQSEVTIQIKIKK